MSKGVWNGSDRGGVVSLSEVGQRGSDERVSGTVWLMRGTGGVQEFEVVVVLLCVIPMRFVCYSDEVNSRIMQKKLFDGEYPLFSSHWRCRRVCYDRVCAH